MLILNINWRFLVIQSAIQIDHKPCGQFAVDKNKILCNDRNTINKKRGNMGLSISTYLMLGVQLSKEDLPEEVFNEYEENSQIEFDEPGIEIQLMDHHADDQKFVVGLNLGKLEEDELVCESEVATVYSIRKVKNAIESKGIDMEGKNVRLILFHQHS